MTRFLTVAEAAEILELTRQQTHNLVRAGDLKLRRKRVLSRRDVERLRDKRERQKRREEAARTRRRLEEEAAEAARRQAREAFDRREGGA